MVDIKQGVAFTDSYNAINYLHMNLKYDSIRKISSKKLLPLFLEAFDNDIRMLFDNYFLTNILPFAVRLGNDIEFKELKQIPLFENRIVVDCIHGVIKMRRSQLRNIKKEHILKAIKVVKDKGINLSGRYEFLFKGIRYSPVQIVKIASKEANGVEFSTISGGKQTNNILIDLGFTVVLKGTNTAIGRDYSYEKKLNKKEFIFPKLESDHRESIIKVYNSCGNGKSDTVVYEYLFNSKSHKWINENIIDWTKDYEWNSPADAILRYVGVRNHHKGKFKGWSIEGALKILEQQDSDFSLVIQSLKRYEEDNYSNDEVNPTDGEYVELESIVKADSEQIEFTETDREQVVKGRIGQSTFKRDLVNIQKKCIICGVSDKRFLVASHIKPWSQSDNQERLDVNNGLLLCPNHDALFDKGYISFGDDGSILISGSLDEATKVFMNINETMNINMNESQHQYMKWHRENKFENPKMIL